MNFILHLVGSKIHNDLYTLSYTYVDTHTLSQLLTNKITAALLLFDRNIDQEVGISTYLLLLQRL